MVSANAVKKLLISENPPNGWTIEDKGKYLYVTKQLGNNAVTFKLELKDKKYWVHFPKYRFTPTASSMDSKYEEEQRFCRNRDSVILPFLKLLWKYEMWHLISNKNWVIFNPRYSRNMKAKVLKKCKELMYVK